MKKYLISPELKQFKANMHCHSTCSDGKLTIEQIKEGYLERGYSIVAFSDHRTLNYHKQLQDENFIPLVSSEMDISQPGEENFNLRQSFHFNVIPRDPENFEQFEYDNSNYSIEKINTIIKQAKEQNCIVVANHPNWSLLTEDEFAAIDGLDGFELYNCITANYGGALSFTPTIYMYLQRNGKYVMPIGGDDNHSFNLPFSHPHNDSFGAVTYIMADELKYEKIIEALDNKNCYCSMGPDGPEFKEISVEDADNDTVKVTVKTNDVRQIAMLGDARIARRRNAAPGETVNEFSFDFARKSVGKFIVFHATDNEGKRAMTRAFILGEDF